MHAMKFIPVPLSLPEQLLPGLPHVYALLLQSFPYFLTEIPLLFPYVPLTESGNFIHPLNTPHDSDTSAPLSFLPYSQALDYPLHGK